MCVDIRFMAAICRGVMLTATLVLVEAVSPVASAQELITVMLDQAKIAKLPERATTMVVGNPLIADVSIQAGGIMVVTGKGYGVTNLIVLDRAGKVLSDQLVQVKSPVDNIIIYRGIARESYSCAPDCAPRITLGDSPDYFEGTLNQTGTRNSRAQQGQSAATPGR